MTGWLNYMKVKKLKAASKEEINQVIGATATQKILAYFEQQKTDDAS